MEITTAIASAVEQQGVATQEIARSIQEAAHGTQLVSSNITGVNEAVGETGAAALRVLGSPKDLGGQAVALRADVTAFLSDIRAA